MRYPLLSKLVLVAVAAAGSAGAQYGPPPPGSAFGTESGSYGSSIGFDVRGTAPVDRFGRPNDLMNPTDTGRKPVDPRDAREKGEDADRLPANVHGNADARGSMPGANMNPGLGATAPGSASQPSVSPNVNPGMTAPRAGGAGPGARGSVPGGAGAAPAR